MNNTITTYHKAITTAIVSIAVGFSVPRVGAVSEFAMYADSLAGSGIINPELSEGGYRLNDLMTRAESVKLAVKLKARGITECRGNIFSDVNPALDNNLCAYTEAAANAGIISRLSTQFRPNDHVTRAELVKMLLSAMEITPSKVPSGFSDVSSVSDFSKYINAGVAQGCIKKTPMFRPNDPSTRGEVFKISACMMKYKKSPVAHSWKMVWSDEFNGNSLDTDKWNLETGADGWGNNELQNYTSTGNVTVSDGTLTIEARKENSSGANYSSARINTHKKASWTYGKIEARIKLPFGQGIWPAFWMLGENIDTVDYPRCGEMDIVEMIGGKSLDNGNNNEATIWGSLHRPNNNPNKKAEVKSITSSFMNPKDVNFGDDYHIFGIEWDTTSVRHYVDGELYQNTDISSKTDGFEVFHKPFYIILNVAIGGNWPGLPNQTTIWPQKMMVDWVRVSQ